MGGSTRHIAFETLSIGRYGCFGIEGGPRERESKSGCVASNSQRARCSRCEPKFTDPNSQFVFWERYLAEWAKRYGHVEAG